MSTVTSPDGTVIAYDRTGSGEPVVLVGGAFSYRRYPVQVKLAEFPAAVPGSTRTAAFILTRNANGTDTLTIDPGVLLDPRTPQNDLAEYGIPAKVTTGSFCCTDPIAGPPRGEGPGDALCDLNSARGVLRCAIRRDRYTGTG
jgi:hypothetical protein